MPATDPLQQLGDAMATIVTADATVQSICARTTDLFVRWRRRRSTPMPRLAFVAGPTSLAGGLGENYDVPVLMRAEANDAATANALLRAGVEALTVMAFEALNCDAVVLEADYDNPPDDAGDPGTDANAVIAEADLVVNLTL